MRLEAFSLIELMFTLAIVSILTMLAVPKYQHYLERARFFEVVQASYPLKLAVEMCFQSTQDLTACSSGHYGIPNQAQMASTLVGESRVDQGVITLVPKERYGFGYEDDYILTPSASLSGYLDWHLSGGAVDKGLVVLP